MTVEKKNIDGPINNEHAVRKEKVTNLLATGISPWASSKKINATTRDVLEKFSDNKSAEQNLYKLAGRIMSRRDHGKTFFAHLQDRNGQLQLYIKKETISEKLFDLFVHLIDIGDIIWVQGNSFRTKKGEISLRVTDITLLSKCLYPLPEKYHGLIDIEQRYRQRYLDLISNKKSLERFVQRSKIIESVRNFLLKNNFLEVETPVLHPIPGGATARPFTTHHHTFDMQLYLRIAPELYLKRLIVGGLERVFEISRNFRNEGVSTRHNPEFTSVEFYEAHADCMIGLERTENLLHSVVQENSQTSHLLFQDHSIDFSKPFARMSMIESVRDVGCVPEEQLNKESIHEALEQHALEIRPHASFGEKLFLLFEELVEHKLIQPTFITQYPIEVSPLARRNDNDPTHVDRFELFIAGMEFANGFTELTDPFEQAQRFHQQVAARDQGDQEAHHYDAQFVNALEYGMPPSVGVGIGIDRLIMLLTNTTSIKDVILFPTLKKLHNE